MDTKRDELQRDVAALARCIAAKDGTTRQGWRVRQYRQKLGKQDTSICDAQRSQHNKATMDESLQRIQDEKRAKAVGGAGRGGGRGHHHQQQQQDVR